MYSKKRIGAESSTSDSTFNVGLNMFKINYQQLEEDTFELAKKIKEQVDLSKVDLVSISRGGLFVGGLLSYLLDLKRNHILCLESYQENKAGTNHNIKEILSFNLNLDPSRIYLFVDDVNDTGQTCRYVREKMKELNYLNYFAVVYNKTNSTCTPDFFGKQIPSDLWIEFPWDSAVDNFKTFTDVSTNSSLNLLEIGLEQVLDNNSYNQKSKK